MRRESILTPRKISLVRKIGLVFVMGAIATITPMESHAQSGRSSLNKRLDIIEKQMKAVQRKVFKPGSKFPRSAPATTASPQGVSGGSVRLADIEARLSQMETQLRQLTGRIEEGHYQAGRLKQKLETMARDYEFRLAALEKPAPASSEGAKPDAPKDISTEKTGKNIDILPPGTGKQQYSYAQKLVIEGQYAKAEQALSEFLRHYPHAELAGNAQYWLGQTYYVRKMYTKATRAFLEGYNNYPGNRKAPAFLLKIGMSLNAMGEKADACDAYRELASRFPDSMASKNKRPPEEKRAGCK